MFREATADAQLTASMDFCVHRPTVKCGIDCGMDSFRRLTQCGISLQNEFILQ